MTDRTGHFEDYRVGQTQQYGSYSVTREEIVEFAREFDPQPFHLDEAAAAASPFGGLIASGWHTAAMMMRMITSRGTGGPILASPGFENLRWLKPVRPGDVLSVRSTVRETRASRSKPDRGLVKFNTEVLNQHGEPVMTLVSMALMKRRPGNGTAQRGKEEERDG